VFLRATIDGQIEAIFLMADFDPQFHDERRSEDHEYAKTRSSRSYKTAKLSYYIEAKNPPNLTGKIQKDWREFPLSIKRQKKTENVRGNLGFHTEKSSCSDAVPRTCAMLWAVGSESS
jgi:hypothetical protein